MMRRWLQVGRGMLGTGLTFAAGVGLVGLLFGLVGLAFGALSWPDLKMVARLSVVAFLVGMTFSAFLAAAARGRPFERLSLRFVTALGAGGGLLYFLFISISGARQWSVPEAIANLSILAVLGAGSAAATLLIARRAGRALGSGTESPSLGEGTTEARVVTHRTEHESRR
jgi:hypothetical protein